MISVIHPLIRHQGLPRKLSRCVRQGSQRPKGAAALKDHKRVVVDTFGPLNDQHTGTVHNVKAIQVGGHERPGSFAIACMGARMSCSHPDPYCFILILSISAIDVPRNQGVYVYTPVGDSTNGTFRQIKVTDESAGRLAIADFNDSSAKVCSTLFKSAVLVLTHLS